MEEPPCPFKLTKGYGEITVSFESPDEVCEDVDSIHLNHTLLKILRPGRSHGMSFPSGEREPEDGMGAETRIEVLLPCYV